MEKIRILGISASPRKNGNSHFLLKKALEAAETAARGMISSEIYSISGKTFNPCDACNQCHDRLGYCRQTDDDFGELRDKWFAADAIIYSVPVYHMGVPGQFKIFLDRLGNSVVDSFVSRPLKVIGTIAQGSGISTGQEQTIAFLNSHAIMMGCIPVGSEWPAGYLGSGGWTRVRVDKKALQELYAEGEEDANFTVEAIKIQAKFIVQMTQIIKSGGAQQREMLEKDGGYDFFLRRLDNKPVIPKKPGQA
ncbi:MAG: flavodoxin family protein [Anaerolineae bacterium]|jgi:multimeric flavodoxin WrbA|nr:flavodoxin family protein [Anaerolineae bacterium]MBT7191397.1 flavodoxin family protein [Anaerolineae bacterium]MBT7989085.1 flavodoxin family protein [Anaerolineae bacterium]